MGGYELVASHSLTAVKLTIDSAKLIAPGLLSKCQGDGFNGLANLAGLVLRDHPARLRERVLNRLQPSFHGFDPAAKPLLYAAPLNFT